MPLSWPAVAASGPPAAGTCTEGVPAIPKHLLGEPYRTLDTIIQEIEAVPGAQVAEVASEFLAPERQTVQRLGPEKQ